MYRRRPVIHSFLRRQGAASSSSVSNMSVATRWAAPAANRPWRSVRLTGTSALPCPVPRSFRSSCISTAIWRTPPRILRTGSIRSSRCEGSFFGCNIRTSSARVTSAGNLAGCALPTRVKTIFAVDSRSSLLDPSSRAESRSPSAKCILRTCSRTAASSGRVEASTSEPSSVAMLPSERRVTS